MTSTDPAETAWKIHAALVDWTGKVDAKASFALTIESAVLAGAVGLSNSGSRFGNLTGVWPLLIFWAGAGLLAVSVVLSVLVVMPRTRNKNVPTEWPSNFIYFGHLQHWSPEPLEQALRDLDPLPMLSRQLVVMSKIACTKHRRVQESFAAALVGAFLLVIAGMIA
ncbi:Pycsar system effector family protein [Micromonospora siamensis]|uniref:Pycsar system effector family protein n=1 Tax=Micromonospora siamensis TaxID=299152 RepID=UPI000B5AC2F4|nr:Pycsar system effector family protein [Micromonospora siamensis]